jgi:hypothetical protein
VHWSIGASPIEFGLIRRVIVDPESPVVTRVRPADVTNERLVRSKIGE